MFPITEKNVKFARQFKMDISVVIPLFNEEESLQELHDWIVRVMNANNYTYDTFIVTGKQIGRAHV